jgi:FMN-dependent NADH-azoreductase
MGEASISRHLTREFAQRWLSANPQGRLISQDLTTIAIPVIDSAWVTANYTPKESRTQQQNDLLRLSAEFTRELLDADEYVIGVPVHNWGPSASFKLWVDHIVTPFGPKLHNKRATFILAAGRFYSPSSGNASKNYVEQWLRTLFGRLGIEDMRFIVADGAAQVRNGQTDLAAFLAPHIEAIQALFVEVSSQPEHAEKSFTSVEPACTAVVASGDRSGFPVAGRLRTTRRCA